MTTTQSSTSPVTASTATQDPAVPSTYSSILAAARGLRDPIRSLAERIESDRRLPGDLVAKLRGAGAFRMAMPTSWGGPQLTSSEQIRIIEEYSKASASVGWCVMIGADSGLYSAWLDDEVARDMYRALDVIQAGWVYPSGKAVAVDNGYAVSGHWTFGSGSQHCDWLAAGCWVYRNTADAEAGRPSGQWRVMLARREEYEIQDTWYSTGLRGTGSTDYSCHQLFVPTEHTFSFLEPTRRPGTLYAANDTFLRKMAGIPLGLARAALDDATELLNAKVDRVMGVPYREMPRIHAVVAEAECRLGSARAFVFESIEELWTCLQNGAVPDKHQRARVWLARTNAFLTARWIARAMYDAIGGSAVYEQTLAFGRYLRDAETMCQHVCGQTKGFELVGAMLFDPEGGSPQPFLNATPRSLATQRQPE